jgi:hypothetical protein
MLLSTSLPLGATLRIFSRLTGGQRKGVAAHRGTEAGRKGMWGALLADGMSWWAKAAISWRQ